MSILAWIYSLCLHSITSPEGTYFAWHIQDIFCLDNANGSEVASSSLIDVDDISTEIVNVFL